MMHLRSLFTLVLFIVHIHICAAAAQMPQALELPMIAQPSSSQNIQEFVSESLAQARQGIAYMNQGATQEGSSCFASVLKSGDVQAKQEIGCWYFDRQEYNNATLYFQQTGSGIYVGYESACNWSDLGTCYLNLNNLQQAQECLERATMLFDAIKDKEDVTVKQSALLATYNLGLVHWKLGKQYDAWECWGAVAQHSYCVEALQVIATMLLKNNKFDDAERVFLRIDNMKVVPDTARAAVANNLGVIACKKLQSARAHDYFTRAAALGNVDAQDNLRKLNARIIKTAGISMYKGHKVLR